MFSCSLFTNCRVHSLNHFQEHLIHSLAVLSFYSNHLFFCFDSQRYWGGKKVTLIISLYNIRKANEDAMTKQMEENKADRTQRYWSNSGCKPVDVKCTVMWPCACMCSFLVLLLSDQNCFITTLPPCSPEGMVFGSPNRQLWHMLSLLCGTHRSEQLLLQCFSSSCDLLFYEAETGLNLSVHAVKVMSQTCPGHTLPGFCWLGMWIQVKVNVSRFTNSNLGGFHLDKKPLNLDSGLQERNTWPRRARSSGTFICQFCVTAWALGTRGSLSWLTQYLKALATRKLLFEVLQLFENTHIHQ